MISKRPSLFSGCYAVEKGPSNDLTTPLALAGRLRCLPEVMGIGGHIRASPQLGTARVESC